MKAIASEVLWAQIPDFGAPVNLELFDEQLNQVCSWLARGGRAHVSCYAGIGRTGLAIACIRVRSLGESPQDALAAAWKACGGPATALQKDFVHEFARFGAWRGY
jgi:protein-tyrosine phosphatase